MRTEILRKMEQIKALPGEDARRSYRSSASSSALVIAYGVMRGSGSAAAAARDAAEDESSPPSSPECWGAISCSLRVFSSRRSMRWCMVMHALIAQQSLAQTITPSFLHCALELCKVIALPAQRCRSLRSRHRTCCIPPLGLRGRCTAATGVGSSTQHGCQREGRGASTSLWLRGLTPATRAPSLESIVYFSIGGSTKTCRQTDRQTEEEEEQKRLRVTCDL